MSEPIVDQVDRWFTYHAPRGDQPDRYIEVRARARDLAHLLIGHCPASPERDRALECLRETVMWANASIALEDA